MFLLNELFASFFADLANQKSKLIFLLIKLSRISIETIEILNILFGKKQ